jgi:predicted dehydrogenase
MTNTETYLNAAAAAQPPRPKSPRPIVILGAGGIIRAAHLPAYTKAGFPVIALADPVPGKAAELAAEAGVPHSFESIQDAIRFAPADAIFDIATPASQLMNILPHLPEGSAVLFQKPMGETLQEATAIRDLCRNRGLTAAVNLQLRYAPNNLAAVALAQAGLLGELHDMEIQVRTYTPWQLWTFLSTAPRLEVLYHSIHYLDLIRSWLGNPLGVYAKTVRNPLTASLAATKSSVILDYGEWKRVFVVSTHTHDLADTYQRSFVQWEGTAGAMRMDMGLNLDYPTGRPDTLRFIERGSASREWVDIPIEGRWVPDAFMGSMGALQAFVEGTVSTLPSSFEDAYQTMALVEAVYRSSNACGEPLPLEGSEPAK